MTFQFPNPLSYNKTVRFLLLSLLVISACPLSANHCTGSQYSSTFTYNTDTYTAVAASPWLNIPPIWTRVVGYSVSRVRITTHACYATLGDYWRNQNLINPISTRVGPFQVAAVTRREYRYNCPAAPPVILPPGFTEQDYLSAETQSDTLPTTYPNSLEAISDSIGYPGQRLDTTQTATFASINIDYSGGFNRAAIPMNTLNQIGAAILPNDRLDTIFIEFETALLSVAADLSNGSPQNSAAYQNFSQLLNELANYPDLVQEPVYTSAMPFIQDAANAMGNLSQIVNGGFPSPSVEQDFLDGIESFRQGLLMFSNEVHHNISDLSHSHMVPTLSEWGLVFLVLLLLNLGGIALFRRTRKAPFSEKGF